MKKVVLILSLVAAPFFLRAQDSATSNFPHWTISKEVQRQAYRDVATVPVTLTITDVSATVSKNIHRTEATPGKPAKRTGYPSWTISKPAARQSFERGNKKD